MARAALDWSREDLAKKVGITSTSIKNIESGDVVPRESSLSEIQAVLEQQGLDFTDQQGVKFKTNIVTVYEGKDALRRFFDDVYYTILPQGGSEILTSGVQEEDYTDVDSEFVDLHLARMLKLPNISHKILCKKDDDNFITPYAEYRSVEDTFFHSTPFYVYGDKMAVILWGVPVQIMIFNHQRLAEAYRKQFYALWANAGRYPTKGKK